jgi:hypothetical protein
VKIVDRGSRYFGVSTTATDIPNLRTLSAEFDRRDGRLVDVECNRVSCDRFRGTRLNTLLRKMQCEGSKKVGLNHCTSGELYGSRRRRKRK